MPAEGGLNEQFSIVRDPSAQLNNDKWESPMDGPTMNEKFEKRDWMLVRMTASALPEISPIESVVRYRAPSIAWESVVS
jgi:hypothetical protein